MVDRDDIRTRLIISLDHNLVILSKLQLISYLDNKCRVSSLVGSHQSTIDIYLRAGTNPLKA